MAAEPAKRLHFCVKCKYRRGLSCLSYLHGKNSHFAVLNISFIVAFFVNLVALRRVVCRYKSRLIPELVDLKFVS